MAKQPAIQFAKPAMPGEGAIVLLIQADGKLPPMAAALDHDGRISQAMKTAEFTGKNASVLDIVAPAKGIERLVLAGIGARDANKEADWLKTGGKIFASVSRSAQATILADGETGDISGDALALIAAGAKLRSYDFDTYKTKDRKEAKLVRITFAAEAHAAAKKAFKLLDGVTDGVMTARDLVNEPANILGPVEFAERARTLEKLGVEVEVLDEKALRKLKMGAFLGVAQGSVRPPRLVVMKWNGGKAKEQPLAFIGKGVVFDTGGISIKPAAGMEDMKGDMGGAAAVTGLMHALAARKARANVIGIIGLVENMP
ncbi:MAG: leucyl aminopeptidase, partial [Nitratireductor sp.]|nr:leucyl aminopeptidase [Nitratireductor sp.]